MRGAIVQRCLYVLALDVWRKTDPEVGACSVN